MPVITFYRGCANHRFIGGMILQFGIMRYVMFFCEFFKSFYLLDTLFCFAVLSFFLSFITKKTLDTNLPL